jgi:hypothetical protein
MYSSYQWQCTLTYIRILYSGLFDVKWIGVSGSQQRTDDSLK